MENNSDNIKRTVRAIIVKNEKVLLIKREKENNIYYSTPGGSQEENETEKETLTRELQEEIAFHIKNAKWIFSFSTIS